MNDSIVSDSLRVIAGFSRSRRAHLVVLNQDWRRGRSVYSWPEKRLGSAHSSYPHPDYWMQSGWWVRKLRADGFVRYHNFSALPVEVKFDLERLREEAITAIGLLAIFDGNRLAGILQLDNPSIDRPIYQADLALLRTATATILQTIVATIDANSVNGAQEIETQAENGREAGNRSRFIQELRTVCDHKGCLFSVILLEIDGAANPDGDSLESSSETLRQFAIERVRASLRRSDLVIDLDKNILGVLLVDMFEQIHAEIVASRILGIVRTPFRVCGQEIEMEACVGVAYPHQGWVDIEELLDQAERALMKSKGQIGLMGETPN